MIVYNRIMNLTITRIFTSLIREIAEKFYYMSWPTSNFKTYGYEVLQNFLFELYRSSGYEFDGEYNSNNLMNNLNSFNNTLPKEMVLENSNDLKNNYSFLKFCKSKNIDIKYFEYILSYFLDLNLKFNEMLRKWKNIIPLFIWKKYRKKNQYKRLFK